MQYQKPDVAVTPRFRDALTYAAELHQHQFRKGTSVPYLSHLLAVSGMVMEAGGDEDEAIAGLLHDGPEDCGGYATLKEIHTRFGTRVADIVEGCTDTLETPKPEWRARKSRYLERLSGESPSLHLVSSADKLHNARAMLADYRLLGDDLWSRFSATRAQQFWYFDSLIAIYRTKGATPLASELARVIQELRTLAGSTNEVQDKAT